MRIHHGVFEFLLGLVDCGAARDRSSNKKVREPTVLFIGEICGDVIVDVISNVLI